MKTTQPAMTRATSDLSARVRHRILMGGVSPAAVTDTSQFRNNDDRLSKVLPRFNSD